MTKLKLLYIVTRLYIYYGRKLKLEKKRLKNLSKGVDLITYLEKHPEMKDLIDNYFSDNIVNNIISDIYTESKEVIDNVKS